LALEKTPSGPLHYSNACQMSNVHFIWKAKKKEASKKIESRESGKVFVLHFGTIKVQQII